MAVCRTYWLPVDFCSSRCEHESACKEDETVEEGKRDKLERRAGKGGDMLRGER